MVTLRGHKNLSFFCKYLMATGYRRPIFFSGPVVISGTQTQCGFCRTENFLGEAGGIEKDMIAPSISSAHIMATPFSQWFRPKALSSVLILLFLSHSTSDIPVIYSNSNPASLSIAPTLTTTSCSCSNAVCFHRAARIIL